MAIALLNIPLNMLSNSFQPVITERLVALRDGEKSHRFYDKMLLIILAISTLCFLFIYVLPWSQRSRFYLCNVIAYNDVSSSMQFIIFMPMFVYIYGAYICLLS